MISAFVDLFRSFGGGYRIYVNGIEIDKIEPRLPFLDLDDWLTPFFTYVFEQRHDWGKELYFRTDEDPVKNPKTKIREVWFGPVPADRRATGWWTTAVYEGKKEDKP